MRGLSLVILGLMPLLVAGCGPASSAPAVARPLVVVTCWSAEERRALEAKLDASERPRWIVCDPGGDFARTVERIGKSADLALGGPETTYREWARLGKTRSWQVVRTDALGVAVRPQPLAERGIPFEQANRVWETPALRDSVGWEDPRRDPRTFALARAWLADKDWTQGYGRLVRIAGNARSVPLPPGGVRGDLARGAVDAVLAEASEFEAVAGATFVPFAPPVAEVEGGAVLASASDPDRARAWLAKIGGQEPKTQDEASAGLPKTPLGIELLRDLLGATLVEAQPELRSAVDALIETKWPERPTAWLAEPPPWPPASVQKLRESEGAGLAETLAEQIMPEDRAQVWLLSRWEHPARPIDGALLDELAEAMEGRVIREPRFRAWLKAEWVAWARQRYRRVERMARNPMPSTATPEPAS